MATVRSARGRFCIHLPCSERPRDWTVTGLCFLERKEILLCLF